MVAVDSAAENRTESGVTLDCGPTALAGMRTNQFYEDSDFRMVGSYKIRARLLFC